MYCEHSREGPSENQLPSRQAFHSIGNLTYRCFTRRELVLAPERGLSVSPLDVSKSQGKENKMRYCKYLDLIFKNVNQLLSTNFQADE